MAANYVNCTEPGGRASAVSFNYAPRWPYRRAYTQEKLDNIIGRRKRLLLLCDARKKNIGELEIALPY